MTPFLVLAAAFSAGAAFAADGTHRKDLAPNSVAIRADYGSADYHWIDLRGKFRLDETFDGLLDLQHERGQGAGAAGAARAQLGARLFDPLHARAAFLFQKEPNVINGFGFGAGLDWTANPRDDDEHETVLSLDYQTVTYRQKGGPAVAEQRLSHRFLQREWTLRWAQELNESFSTLLFVSIDSYASAQGNLVNTATDFRRRPLPDLDGTVAGLPHYSFGLGARFHLSDDWRLGLDASRAEIYNVATAADSLACALSLQVDTDWWLGMHASYFKQEELDAVAAAGLSITYEFE